MADDARAVRSVLDAGPGGSRGRRVVDPERGRDVTRWQLRLRWRTIARFATATHRPAMDRAPDAPPPQARILHQGELYWLPPDPSRGSVPGVPHPHLIVQDDLFNHSRIGTVVVCALSSNLNRASEPGNVLLEPGEGGLTRHSVIVVSQVSSVYKAHLGERIGSLSEARVAQVLAGMRFLQAAFHRR